MGKKAKPETKTVSLADAARLLDIHRSTLSKLLSERRIVGAKRVRRKVKGELLTVWSIPLGADGLPQRTPGKRGPKPKKAEL